MDQSLVDLISNQIGFASFAVIILWMWRKDQERNVAERTRLDERHEETVARIEEERRKDQDRFTDQLKESIGQINRVVENNTKAVSDFSIITQRIEIKIDTISAKIDAQAKRQNQTARRQ